jgi:charged multivesicular body protein 5
MKKIFGAKKNKDPPPTIQDATDRVCIIHPKQSSLQFSNPYSDFSIYINLIDSSSQITKRGDTVDEKIKKLDAELARYKEQIKKTRPGPAQEAVKARAMRVLKQRRM